MQNAINKNRFKRCPSYFVLYSFVFLNLQFIFQVAHCLMVMQTYHSNCWEDIEPLKKPELTLLRPPQQSTVRGRGDSTIHLPALKQPKIKPLPLSS